MPDNSTTNSLGPRTDRPTARPKPSFSRRFATASRAWARSTFSRESLVSSFKTFLWVAVLTPLIWIYAEREQLATQPNVQIKVQPHNADPSRVVTFGEMGGNSTITVSADLSGPHGRLEQVQKQLEAAGTVQIEVGSSLDAGPHRISTRSIGNDLLFVTNGVTVTNFVPSEVTVYIDPIETRELPVQAPNEIRNSIAKISFEPKNVRVSAPASFFRKNPGLFPRAELQSADSPGSHEESVSVAPSIPDPHLTISPPAVIARYDVRKKDVIVTILSMPVWATYPPAEAWKTYYADFPATIQNIRVIGPEETLQRMLNDSTFQPKPHASFDVVSADPPIDITHPDQGGPYTAKLHFELPPGVQLVAENKEPMIEFTIKARPKE